MSKKEGEKTSSSLRSVAAKAAIAKKLMLESLVKKAEYYSGNSSVTDNDLYYIVKDFFRKFLDLDYEFSFDELLIEIDKTYMESQYREKTISLIKRVERIEYANAGLSPTEINNLMNEFYLLSKGLLKMSEHKKSSFWNNFTEFFVKQQKSNAKIATSTIETKPIVAVELSKDSQIKNQQTSSTSSQTISQTKSSAYNQRLDSLEDNYFNLTKEKIPMKNKDLLIDIQSSNSADAKSQTEQTKNKYYSAEPDVYTKYYNTKDNKISPQKTDAYDWLTPAETEADKNTKPKTESKQPAKQDILKSKSEVTNVSQSKDKNKNTKKDDIDSMIVKAKKLKNKKELIAIYKKIHFVYEKEDVEMQTKHYQDIMDIYKSISKLK